MCVNFQAKQTMLTFLTQICPKMDLNFEIEKTNIGIRISILEIPCVPIFRQKRQLWHFRPKFAQKWVSKSGFGISNSKIPSVPIFSQNGELIFFGLNLGNVFNYVRYFGCNNAEDVAESWVEAEMSWVELDGAGWRLKWAVWRWMELGARFSNTH